MTGQEWSIHLISLDVPHCALDGHHKTEQSRDRATPNLADCRSTSLSWIFMLRAETLFCQPACPHLALPHHLTQSWDNFRLPRREELEGRKGSLCQIMSAFYRLLMTAPLTGVRCEVVEVFGVTTQVEEEERRGQWMYHSSALWAQAVSVSVSVLCTINGVMFGQGKSRNLFCAGWGHAQLESDSERKNITQGVAPYCTVRATGHIVCSDTQLTLFNLFMLALWSRYN